MSRTKTLVLDGLFVAQIVLATIFCGKQFFHMLANGAEGVSVVMFISVEVFVGINLILSVRAHKAQPSRVTWQAVVAYRLWTVLWGANLVVLLRYLFVTDIISWGGFENLTVVALLVSCSVIVLWAYRNKVGINDPMVRGYTALAFKGLPQLFQGGKFLLYGGAGFNPVSIALGHVTILIRIGQLLFSNQEAVWDRNRRGSLVSEIGNEISWILATAAWLWWRFNGEG